MTLHIHRRFATLARTAGLAIAAFASMAAPALAQTTVNLIAAPFTKPVTLPNGTTIGVPMWGFALDANNNGMLDAGEAPSAPGPRLTVPAGTNSLTVNLKNLLPAPVSIVILGQIGTDNAPVRDADGRITSMVPVALPNGLATYRWNNLRPGTFIYESGTHQAVQVQMGLYGALTKDAQPNVAYPGIAYDHEAMLLYSEIDVALHQAVADGTYGTPAGPTSTIDYNPTIFLVNGAPYRPGAPAIDAGAAGDRTIVRMLNAGLRSHVPVVDNAAWSMVAEDGNPYGYPHDQASILLPAAKTQDVIWTPVAGGLFSVYDRTLHLMTDDQPKGGMLATLRIGDSSGGGSGGTGGGGTGSIATVADAYPATEDTVLNGPSVLANDTGASLTAELFTSVASGTLVLNPAGTFTYTPNPNFFGRDSFQYRAVSGTERSQPTTVDIEVAPVDDAPSALPASLGLMAREAKPITVSGIDADGDPLSFYVTQLPAHGSLSVVDPTTAARVTLTAADLYSAGATRRVLPGATVTYTPTVAPAPFSGADTFSFCVSDGHNNCAGASAVAAVGLTVDPLPSATATGTPVALVVKGSDGATIGGYRWTLEEDRTYDVIPGALDPDTLAVRFHASYMPVVQHGDESSQPRVDPTKRYFISVLPKAGGYSNGGAPIARNQGTVTVYVNKTPLPTAQVRVHVFKDNSPLNGQFDADEEPLAGFEVTLDDAGGRYGMSGGQMTQDIFGNPLGTTYKPCSTPGGCDGYEIAQRGNGFVLTDADGYATFSNLPMGKFTAKVIPPSGQNWVQTVTIEGQKGQDAWVKPNEPAFFAEFGPPGPHVEIGFAQPTRGTSVLGVGAGPFTTVTGTVTGMHMSRPPQYQFFSGAPYDWTTVWVGLNSGTNGGLIWAQPADDEGGFTIPQVPAGSYTLTIWDDQVDLIIASKTITVEGESTLDLGEVPVFPWFTRLYHYVFEDLNKNGLRDPGERGIREMAINTRWRDGTIYQTSATDGSGFVPFEETFPFFAYQIAEVDYSRFRATGVTIVVDNGGNVSTNTTWPQQVQADLDSRVLAPQPQSENGGAAFRTETGPVLLEAFQGFIGMTNLFMWGKAPYDVAGSHPTDVNVAPFDDFPGPGDTDWNTNGAFDVDEFNGGITGIVHYSTTRAENNARWGTPEFWEPGIPGVRVQLWDKSRTHLLNEVVTDSWDDNPPTGCQGEEFVYLGKKLDCYDGLRNFNQVRPGVFDGGYAFYTVRQSPTAGHEYDLPLDQRTIEKPLPAGDYVVKVVVPDGYQLVKEEDKNVDFGDEYIPQEFWLTGYDLADAGGPGEAQPKEAAWEDPIGAPFCVGSLHTVPNELSLFPGVPGTYAGDQMPLCDEKLVAVRDGQNAAANFFLFTEAPIAGHIIGFVLDDLANEFDQNSPQFGEKYAPPFLPISVRDWTGREITHTYTDRWGVYNALVPSTYTAATPIPSGMSPNMLTVCINSPVKPDATGNLIPDPFYDKRYTQFCYTLQYMPGTTTYLDTPVLPNSAYTGPGQSRLDAELPDHTPVIFSVNGPDNIGPYVVPVGGAANAATRTITIRSAGNATVPNPLYDGFSESVPQTITRDYGFGAVQGQVFVGDRQLTNIVSWSNAEIRVLVPVNTPSGELRVVRCLDTACAERRGTAMGVTLTVATPTWNTNHPPHIVTSGGSIQKAIDDAAPGDLILVAPGTYEESVIMDKPVRLQGWGAWSTTINAVKTPAEKLQQWRERVFATLTAHPDYLMPAQASAVTTGFDQSGELLGPILGGEGAGVTVLGRALPINGEVCTPNLRYGDQGYGLQLENSASNNNNATRPRSPKARIDGFSITGSDAGAGVEINANACYLQVSNNHIYSNMGDFAGGVKIGLPGALVEFADDDANNDRVSVLFNHISQNGSQNEDGGGGAVGIGTGADNYLVANNFIVGNFSQGYGGGVSHIGLSTNGTIADNTIVFNETFAQTATTNGGGVFIGGRAPAAGELSPGAGNVTVARNLIQGNSAAGGDGGGIDVSYVNGQEIGSTTPYRVELFGNTIVNNVAGLAGGGVALQDAVDVRIVNNTIARNDSLAVAGAAFSPRAGQNDPFISTAQPAGIVSRAHSPELRAVLSSGAPSYSRPMLLNSIVWQNRSFYFGPTSGGVQNPGDLTGPTYGLLPRAAGLYWDLGVLGGGTGANLNPQYSVLTSTAGVGGSNNTTAPPQFLRSYFNGDRDESITQPEVTTGIAAPAAFDEGGNFIRPMFGPLTLNHVTDGLSYGDYHLLGGVNGRALVGTGNLYPNVTSVPELLRVDADGDNRVDPIAPNSYLPHRGADQANLQAGTGPVVPTVSVGDASILEGDTGTSNLTFTLTLSQPTTATVTVDWATAEGTASDYVDYVGAAGTATFAPGVTTQTVTIAVKGDTGVEPDETLLLNLGLPVNVTIADGQGIGTIRNDDTAANPALAVADTSSAEGNAGTSNMVFTVTLSGASTSVVTVQYATADGTATAGSDYTSSVGSLTFNPGETSHTVVVPVTGDLTVEPNETVLLNLSAATNATIADGQAIGTIVNDDGILVPPTMSIADTAVTEGNVGTTSMIFTVTLSAPSLTAVSVQYATSDGTATAGSDYTPAAGSLTIPVGQTSGTITVPIIGDTEFEGNETLFVTLTAPTGATLFDGQATGTINNDDAASIDVAVDRIVSSDGRNARTVQLTTSGPDELILAFVASDGPNAANAQTVTVSGGGLSWSLVRRQNAQAGTSEIWKATATSPLSNANITSTQSNTGGNYFQSLTVVAFTGASDTGATNGRSASTGAPSVSITTTQPNSLVWGVGNDWDSATNRTPSADQTIVHQYLASVGDTFWVQSLTAAVASPSTVAISDTAPTTDRFNLAAVEIKAAGTAPLPTLSVGNASVSEGNAGVTSLSFTATLSAPSGSNVSVQFATANGTATAGSDYTAASGTLTIPAGLTSGTITVQVAGDTTVEPNETVLLNLSNAAGASLLTAQATGTILNDDAVGVPTLSVANVSVLEGNTGTATLTFTAALTAPSASDVTVQYTTADGTATAGSDYTTAAGTLTIPAGLTSGTIAVTLTGDTTVEPNETVLLNLSNPVGATLLTTQATGTITNDDGPLADQTVFSDGQGARTATVTTTVPNELILAFVGSDGPNGGGAQTVTVSGGGLSWTLVRRQNTRAGTSEVWRATGPATPGAVAVTSTQSAGGFYQSLTVVSFIGASTTGASAGAGAVGAPSVSLTTTQTGSLVYGVGNDWDGATARTLGAGQAMVHEYLAPVLDTMWVQNRTTTAGAGTTVQINDTAPTNHQYNLVAIEIIR